MLSPNLQRLRRSHVPVVPCRVYIQVHICLRFTRAARPTFFSRRLRLVFLQVVLDLGDWYVDGNIFMKSGVFLDGGCVQSMLRKMLPHR